MQSTDMGRPLHVPAATSVGDLPCDEVFAVTWFLVPTDPEGARPWRPGQIDKFGSHSHEIVRALWCFSSPFAEGKPLAPVRVIVTFSSFRSRMNAVHVWRPPTIWVQHAAGLLVAAKRIR